MQFLTSNGGLYAISVLLLVVVCLSANKIHNAIKAVEALVNRFLPAPVATLVDTSLEKLDSVAQHPSQQNVADLFAVMEKLVHNGVQNANVLQVNDAKASGIFSKDAAAAVKAAVVSQVLNNMGPMKDVLQAHLGDLAPIVEEMIETKVSELKKTA